MDKKTQAVREDVRQAERLEAKYIQLPVGEVSHLIQQIDKFSESVDVLKSKMIELRNYIARLKEKIELKDKALEKAETFVTELISAVDNCPARLLDVEEIAKDGTAVINSIAALKEEDTKS